MKRISILFTAAIVILMASCNDGDKDKQDDKMANADSSGSITPPTPAPPPAPVFTPFSMIVGRHVVKDFAKFSEVYNSPMADSIRAVYNNSKFRLGRGIDDSNMVYVMEKYTDLQKIQEFSKSSGLKDAMKKAGITGAPNFSYVNMIRGDTSKAPELDRMMVSHKVKDFNAWLKVFDEEGVATRESFGLKDKGLGRGALDSNMVYIVFTVSDMAKAKARAASPELKALMTKAGVTGPPTIYYYRILP